MSGKWGMTVAMLALAGCTTFQDIDTGLHGLRGKPYREAFGVLGFPDAENRIDGKRVFSWGSRQTGSYMLPTFNTSTAYVGGKAITVQTQGTSVHSYDYHCSVSIIVSNSGIIEHTMFDGNMGGCERYAQRFRKAKIAR